MSALIQRLENLRVPQYPLWSTPYTIWIPVCTTSGRSSSGFWCAPFYWDKFIRRLLVVKIKASQPAANVRLKLISWFVISLLCTLDFPHSSLAHSDHNSWRILDLGHCFCLRLWLLYLFIYHLSGVQELTKQNTQLDHPAFKYSLPITHCITTALPAPNGQGQLHLQCSDFFSCTLLSQHRV